MLAPDSQVAEYRQWWAGPYKFNCGGHFEAKNVFPMNPAVPPPQLDPVKVHVAAAGLASPSLPESCVGTTRRAKYGWLIVTCATCG